MTTERDAAAVAAVRQRHRFDSQTGNCTCGWEPTSDKGAEQQQARHVERLLQGRPH